MHMGAYAEGRRHGKGTMRYPDGAVYEATWERGVAQVIGLASLLSSATAPPSPPPPPHATTPPPPPSTAVTSTTFTSSVTSTAPPSPPSCLLLEQGEARFVDGRGNVYEGQMLEGVFEGVGRLTYAQADDGGGGGVHEGQWRAGAPHGLGRRVFADGARGRPARSPAPPLVPV